MNLAVNAYARSVGPTKNILSERHRTYLSERAVDPDLAAYAAGLKTVSAEDGARSLGLGRPLSSEGLLVPYPNVPDYVRVRLDDGRYLVPAMREVPIYIPTQCEREGARPLVVVEGPVKALALVEHGLNPIALGGVATTLAKDGTLNDSWQVLGLVRREVVLLFDANRGSNIAVARAEARLAVALEREGARVRLAALPLRDDGGDQGPDDFVASHNGDPTLLEAILLAAVPADPVELAKGVTSDDVALALLEDLPFLMAVRLRGVVAEQKVLAALRSHGIKVTHLRRALRQAEAKRAHPEGSPAPRPGSSRYEVQESTLCRVSAAGALGEVSARLCNFTASITEDRMVDDGSGQPSRVFVVAGTLLDGTPLPAVSVRPPEFGTEAWVTEKWGARAIVDADVSRPAHHSLNAMKAVSAPTETVAYAHTGFREVGGELLYLHGAGAVGNASVNIEPTGPLARFALPDAVEDMKDAVRTSMAFIGVATGRITRPLHAACYRAPLNDAQYCDAAVAVYGRTGSLKSSVTAAMQSHYGQFEHNSLPLSWESTANALELELFRAKDVLVTIDDYVPGASRFDEIYKKAERVFRAIGNRSARGRLRQDLSSRPDRPCRALVVTTGEDLPRGESIQARLVGIHMRREDVDCTKLAELQGKAARLPHAMRAFIEWLRPRMGQLKKDVPANYAAFRAQLDSAGHDLEGPCPLLGVEAVDDGERDGVVVARAHVRPRVCRTRRSPAADSSSSRRAGAASCAADVMPFRNE